MNDLERICRELCANDGFDPDVMVFPHILAQGARGYAVVPPVDPIPQWLLYRDYVKGTLTMILTGSEKTDLRTLIAEVLSGREFIAEIEEEEIQPPPAPDWRYKRGL